MPAVSVSQNRALTWAIPTSDTASSREAPSGRPVSSWMTSAIMVAHSVVTRSTKRRTVSRGTDRTVTSGTSSDRTSVTTGCASSRGDAHRALGSG